MDKLHNRKYKEEKKKFIKSKKVSYRKKHIKTKIQKIKPKKSIIRKLWFWLILLFLIIIILVLYFFLFYPGIQVKNIIISGNQKVASEDIRNLILSNTSTKILGIGSWEINSNSIFLINSNKLDKKILNKFPSIEQAKINRKFLQSLKITITEREPLGVYCGGSSDNIQQCFFIDKSGIIFESLSTLPGGFTVIRQTLENNNIFVGENVVQQNIILAILKIQKNLKDNFQINLEEALITSPIRLNANTNENWQIYFDLDQNSDIDPQLTKLNLLLSSEISDNERENLQYIDLRPKDRAIICDNKICGDKK